MKKSRKCFTTEELITIWNLYKEGKTNTQIYKYTGRGSGIITGVIKKLRNLVYSFKGIDNKRKYNSYNDAVIEIKLAQMKPEPDGIIKVDSVTELNDPYIQLDKIIENLKEAITNVVVFEVNRKVSEIKKEYEELKDKAKMGNWTENLKRHFEG
jgi:hypothetical protein